MASKYTRYRLKGTTAAGGGASVTTTHVIRGKIHSIMCNTGDLADTADISMVSDDAPNQTILSLTDQAADVVVRPKVLTTLYTGGALTATGNIYTEYVVFSRLTLTIAQGGDAKAFTVDVYVEEY